MTYEQFIHKLKLTGIAYSQFRRSAITYVEVGRFGYRFDEHGKQAGGWIRKCGMAWREEWNAWASLLTEH